MRNRERDGDKWMGLNTRAMIMYVKSLIYGTRMAKSTAA